MRVLGSLALSALMLAPLALAREAPDPSHHVEGETVGQHVRRVANIPEEPAADPRGKVARFFGDLWRRLIPQRSEEEEPAVLAPQRPEESGPSSRLWVSYDPTCHIEGETIGQYVRRIANLDEPPGGLLGKLSKRLFGRRGLQGEVRELLASPEARGLAVSSAAGAGLAVGLVGAGSLGAAGLSGAAATAATLATIGGAVGGGMIAGVGILMSVPVAAAVYAHNKLSKSSGGEGGAEKEEWRDCWEPLLRASR